jgi:metal-responsive CopG/Arc/MetJ family transcriptional regulator
MFKQTIKLDKELMGRIRKCSEVAGYSSPEEFVQHVLERELAKIEETESNEEIARKLKGLGYLD